MEAGSTAQTTHCVSLPAKEPRFSLCQQHQVHSSSPSPATPPPTPRSTRHHHSAPTQAPSTAPATSPSGDLNTPAATAPPRGDHHILEMHLPLLSNHQRWAQTASLLPCLLLSIETTMPQRRSLSTATESLSACLDNSSLHVATTNTASVTARA